MSTKISGSKYAAMYGPTTGDKVRLADTSLVIEVEKDYTTYGDEVKFGGGKTIRDGMGQSVKTCSKDGDLDLVITNALIVDSTGIVKADIGIKDGKIAGIGKAGNPDIMDGVTPGMTVGASTEALAGEGMIVTAGGIDTHIMKNILCCDCLRTDSGICKCNIFRNSLVKVMANHQHIQMLIQSVYCIWHCWVCGGWQYVRSCCCANDIRCMSTACPLCMISMDGSAADGCKCIFHTSTFI